MADYVVEFGSKADTSSADERLDAAAFHRNHQAIWAALAPLLTGKSGDVVEIGSGTGQHVVVFARETPDITWWPSDLNDNHLASIAAWRSHAQLDNVRAPQKIDVSDPDWRPDGPGALLAVFCANVVHIAPWSVAEGLFAGAARLLRPDGRLVLYGPFMRGGRHTAPSNAAFDASLRENNPAWGVRDIAELTTLAERFGLERTDIIEMPANNLVLAFARAAAVGGA